nr:MAG TPA: hypothetical protein [Caudoviricetes sp.]DAV18378.1 MAG TPA: hypothetical protein [Caudoviricetes sp.]
MFSMYPSRRSKLMHLSILHPPYSFLISATFSPPVCLYLVNTS